MRQRLLWFGANHLRFWSIHNARVQPHDFSRLQSTAASSPGLFERYNGLIRQGVLQPDVHQHNIVEAFDNLLQQMAVYDKKMELYHAQLRDWETRRHQLRQKLLQEEAEKEAQRQVKKKLAEKKKSFLKGLHRWYKQLKQRLLLNEAEKEKQWQLHAYGQAASELLRKKRNREVQPGAGRMVSHINREKKLDQLVGPPPPLPSSPKGLYIYGNVGCGKTMLMDMFYSAADGVVKHRRRLHFHAAFLEVHDWMHKLWKKQLEKKAVCDVAEYNTDDLDSLGTEPSTLKKEIRKWLDGEKRFEEENSATYVLDLVAEKLLIDSADAAGGARLLCFDELQVVDVFTAVALAGIFTALIKRGAIIVATSNRAPSDLNKEGMQKEIFDKFIAELQCHCQLTLLGSDTDYRRLLAANENSNWKNYFWPLDKDAHNSLELTWQHLVSEAGGKVELAMVPVMFGRTLEVPQSCKGIARFSFEEICDRPVGAADYIALARNFHTVFVTGIPVMSMRNRDKARRFITLVDELYNHRRQLICTAASSIDELFLGSEEGSLIDLESLQFETEAEDSRLRRDVTLSGSVAPVGSTKEEKRSIQSLLSGREELFAFQRAVSRLIEMQSPIYLQGRDFQIHQRNVERVNIQ
eukprot:c11233_g1_i1 orf=42-1949(+)